MALKEIILLRTKTQGRPESLLKIHPMRMRGMPLLVMVRSRFNINLPNDLKCFHPEISLLAHQFLILHLNSAVELYAERVLVNKLVVFGSSVRIYIGLAI